MQVEELVLRNFRNYDHCRLTLHPGLNILIGQNAQGKTNFLESIHFLATGRSHRTSNHYDLIRWGTTGFFLHASLQKRNVKVTLEFRLTSERQREVKINNVVERKLSSLLGELNAVLFTPEDLQLLKGAPGLRRRFLDMELSQVSPIYLYNLQQYNRALLQRNTLLKSDAEKAALDIWTEQLIKYGARITILRQRALQGLAQYAQPSLYAISGGREELRLLYRPWGQNLPQIGSDEAEVTQLLRETILRQEANELRRKQSLVGPHRDDFVCLLNEIDVREFGSQGQQRSAVLAIKMAELEFMRAVTGDYPILLLDDVLSELDAARRQALLGSVDRGIQTLITGTEANLFTGWQEKALLMAEITDGIISVVN